MIELRLSKDTPARPVIEAVQRIAEEYPGDETIHLLASGLGGAGFTRIAFGREWQLDGSVECLEALSEFGEAAFREED